MLPEWDSGASHIHGDTEQPVQVLSCFWEVGGNRRTLRKSMRTLREHANLHTDSNLSSGLNQEPWSCEVPMLPTAPLWHLNLRI
ncbi:hypothetical protein PGIGA_G00252450, partial [Pangasianodon gigas]|nr:hypothetical protein [Pangasianodon gigas]